MQLSISLEDKIATQLAAVATTDEVSVEELASEAIDAFVELYPAWDSRLRQRRLLRQAPKPHAPPLVFRPASTLSPTIQSIFTSELPELKPLADLDGTFAQTFRQLGIEAVAEPLETAPAGDFRAWSCLVLRVRDSWQTWLDFRLSISRSGAAALYKAMTEEDAATDAQLIDSLVEVLNILQGGVKSALEKESAALIMPFIPRADRCSSGWEEIPLESLPWRRRFHFGDNTMDIALMESRAKTRITNVLGLQPYDVILEKVFASPDSAVPLVNAGTALDKEFLLRLKNLKTKRPLRVTVVKPSKWTMDLCG